VNAGGLIREARLRANLSQADLAARTGREKSHIARWEGGAVEPAFATLQEILRACGYQLSTRLERYVPVDDELQRELAAAAPSERLQRMLDRRADDERYRLGS
jgi:transcriptional regulator with XRE-family HTH domain